NSESFLSASDQEVFAPSRVPALPVTKQLMVLGGLLTFMLVAGGTSLYLSKEDNHEAEPEQISPRLVSDIETDNETEITFADVELAAMSAIVIDVTNNDILFAKEPGLDWPLANITKLMT